MTVIVKNSVMCKLCKQVLVSSHVHDFVNCRCGSVAIDGGKDYLRRIGDFKNMQELSITKVE